jgi:hypothetical protein
MNRTIMDATVKRYFYETHDQRRPHLQNFVDAYNFTRRPKTLRARTPYEFICKAWTSEPHRPTTAIRHVVKYGLRQTNCWKLASSEVILAVALLIVLLSPTHGALFCRTTFVSKRPPRDIRLLAGLPRYFHKLRPVGICTAAGITSS